MYGPEFDRPEINIIQEIGHASNGVIELSTPASQPNLNRFEIQIIGKDKKIKKTHVLDFNLRTGLTSINSKSKPHCISVKDYLGYDDEEEIPILRTQLVIPASWVDQKERFDWFRLTVDDIWGKRTYFSFQVINNHGDFNL